MVLTLTIPEPGKEKRIKDVIIDVLSFEWPLTLSQLHRKIKNDYQLGSSCQATHKAIVELMNNNVLIKQDKFYSISMEWVGRIKDFSIHIEKNYREGQKIPLMDGLLKVKTENNVTILTFDSLIEMDKAWINIKKDYYKDLTDEGDVTFWEGAHCWWLLVYPELEYSEMELLKKKKVRDYTIAHNNTALDLVAKKFYEKAGVKFKIFNSSIDCDMTVFGDNIMQVYLPDDLKKKIHEIYKNCKSPGEVDIHSLLKDVLTKKTQINLILTKNKEIAEQLKQKVIKEFN